MHVLGSFYGKELYKESSNKLGITSDSRAIASNINGYTGQIQGLLSSVLMLLQHL